jgi:hypothetical protein
MAFYFSSDTKALYDTDVFPVASLPANKVEINEETYTELLTKQNQGYVIKADNSGNPYAVAQGEASATDMKHSGSIATTVALGHVKVGNTMKTDANGVLDVKENAISATQIADGSITTPKLADAAVTTAKIANGAVTEEKLDAVKDLLADETSLTMADTSNEFTMSIKDGGVTRAKIADAAIGESKIDEYAVTSTKINPGAVISSKIAEGAVGTNALADGAVTKAKIANESISYLKLDPNIRDVILTFLDSNGNNLNDNDFGHTFTHSNEQFLIGYIPFSRNSSLLDFTIAFEYVIPQQMISTDIEFSLIVYEKSDSGLGTGITLASRTVKVTSTNSFVNERFTFKSDSPQTFDNKIKIDFKISGNHSAVLMKNIQLRGFGIL